LIHFYKRDLFPKFVGSGVARSLLSKE